MHFDTLEPRRLLSGGGLDYYFNRIDVGNTSGQSIVVMHDGRVIVADTNDQSGDLVIHRYHADGTPDPTLNLALVNDNPYVISDPRSRLAVDDHDRLIVVFGTRIRRFTINGQPDR